LELLLIWDPLKAEYLHQGRTQGGLGLKLPFSLICYKNVYYLRKGN